MSLFNSVFRYFRIRSAYAYQIMEKAQVQYAIFDLHGRYVYTNEYYLTDAQLRKEIIGKNDNYLFNKLGYDKENAETRIQYLSESIRDQKTVRFTEKLREHESGRIRYYKRYFQPLFSNGKISGVCLFGNDLTAVVLGQNELKYLAFHDKITGLENREAFYKELDQIYVDLPRIKDGKFTAILFCDLDKFKMVNDTLGHDIGDELLKEVAERLKTSLRKSDMVYRLGGDEFIVIAKHMTHEVDANTIAHKIIKNLSRTYTIKGNTINYLTVSIGVGIIPRDGESREEIIKNADMAMYTAKKAGKNQFQFYSKELTQKSVDQAKIEQNLHMLVNDKSYDNECSLVYQPIIHKVSDNNYKIIGSEALLRWHNREIGQIPPDAFIPVAEDTELISSIGDFVFDRACHDISHVVNNFDRTFFVSINLSAKQLRSGDIISKVKDTVKKIGVDSANIQLEITETSFLEEGTNIFSVLNQLKDLGIKIAIDDFGTGYASLSYLQKIPANIIKIDKSFITQLERNKDNEQLVKSIIGLGNNLEKDVIAEGVETNDHLKFLSKNNCKTFQGFLFSKPVNIDKLKRLIEKKHTYKYKE